MQGVMVTARREGRTVIARTRDAQQQDAKALTVRVPVDLWKSVKIKCVREDTNIQAVLAGFLSEWASEP